MIKIKIPGGKALSLEYLAADYNGTLAEDGKPIEATAELLNSLASYVRLDVVTADTFGTVQKGSRQGCLPSALHLRRTSRLHNPG